VTDAGTFALDEVYVSGAQIGGDSGNTYASFTLEAQEIRHI
jgi:hypothetical protein